MTLITLAHAIPPCIVSPKALGSKFHVDSKILKLILTKDDLAFDLAGKSIPDMLGVKVWAEGYRVPNLGSKVC